MNKPQNLLIAALLLINLGMVAFLFSRPAPHSHDPRSIVIERLQFDEAQIKEYDKFIQQHRQDVRANEKQMGQLRAAFYANLNAAAPHVTDSLALEIGRRQSELELINYHHFEAIKTLCTPEQLTHFEAFSEELSRLFTKNPKKPHR
jgi:periplasmic protein CpxP/Spy